MPKIDRHVRAKAIVLQTPGLRILGSSALSSRQAWARKTHLVELRAWSGPERESFVIEALCLHTILRAVFAGCGRRFHEHDVAERDAILAIVAQEHQAKCPNHDEPVTVFVPKPQYLGREAGRAR